MRRLAMALLLLAVAALLAACRFAVVESGSVQIGAGAPTATAAGD